MFNLQRSTFEVTFQPGACAQTCRLTLISAPMESQISSAWPTAARQYCWLHFPRWPFSPPPPAAPPGTQATAWEVTFLSIPVNENLSSAS